MEAFPRGTFPLVPAPIPQQNGEQMRRYSLLCRSLALAALCIGAAACHHSSSAIPTTTATANAAGIWTGTDSVTGLALTGVIDAAGDSSFIRSDGMLFAGTLLISEATL